MRSAVVGILAIAVFTVCRSAWSATGPGQPPPTGRIAYTRLVHGRMTVWTLHLNTMTLRQVTPTRRDDQFDPSWSPDGRRIAYRYRDDIWVANLTTGARTNVTRSAGPDWSPDWQPNGRIAWASARAGSLNIWTMNARGGSLRRLTRSWGEYPDTSADGRRIVFDRNTPGTDYDVWSMRSDGSGQRNLTDSPDREQGGTWSPDGRRIAFVRGFSETRRALWVMNDRGGAQVRLTRPSHNAEGPVWSPDGHWILLSYDGRLTLIRPDGTDLTTLRVNGRTVSGLFPDWLRR